MFFFNAIDCANQTLFNRLLVKFSAMHLSLATPTNKQKRFFFQQKLFFSGNLTRQAIKKAQIIFFRFEMRKLPLHSSLLGSRLSSVLIIKNLKIKEHENNVSTIQMEE